MFFKLPLSQILLREARYLERQGVRIPPAIRASLARAGEDRSRLLAVYDRLCKLPRPRQAYFSDSRLKPILKARPGTVRSRVKTLPKAELFDRIAGTWLGRAAGCVLGKPLEVGLTLDDVKRYLGRDYPIDNYLRYSVARKICLARKAKLHPFVTRPCSREHVAYAMPDDDLNYTVLNLLLLENYGRAFATSNVGRNWARYLPPEESYGAETTSFANYLHGLPLEEVPVYLNPYREEIGAQIRADVFGYVCPGDPEQAADMAWRDASFSHVAEGIYGEMLFAAVIAAAFTAGTIDDFLDAGLAQVPANCHTASLVRETRTWHSRGLRWEDVYARIKAETADFGAGDTVNNAAYVVNALLAGNGDYEQSVCISVMQGHDADCNGATVGSILGVMLGRKRLPRKWIAPLHDCMRTDLNGHSECRISDLAERTLRVALKLPSRKSSS